MLEDLSQPRHTRAKAHTYCDRVQETYDNDTHIAKRFYRHDTKTDRNLFAIVHVPESRKIRERKLYKFS